MKIEILNSLWYNGFTPKTHTSRKSRKEYKISWIKLYHTVAQNATLKNYINMARISSVIKNINAVFVNINLLPLIKKLSVSANTPLALLAVNLHFFIMTTTIPSIFVVMIRNAITLSFRLNLPL